MIAGLLGLLRGVPLVAWVVVAAIAFGLVQRIQAGRAKAARAVAEKQREAAELQAETARIQQRGTAASLTETTRRIEAQSKVNQDATVKTARARDAGARSAAAAGRLRVTASGLAASAATCNPTAGRDSEASRLADVLVEVIDEYREVAAAADRAVIAGLACQQSYEALTAAPAAREQP